MNSLSYSIVYSACFALIVHCAAAQTVHIVGDSMGWTIPPNTSVSYSNWASTKTFMVGDILEFKFMTNEHDVVQVPKASYDDCSDDDVIGNVITAGPANITLDSAGDRHYICSFGRHCESGQKLSITVVSSSTPGGGGAPPPATPTAPSPATPKTDACAPTPDAHAPKAGPTVPPPPPMFSSSVSLGGSFFIIIMCAGLALII